MPEIFKLTFLPLLIHLSSRPHQFLTLFGGQWGSKGPKEIKIRATKTLLPKCLGIDSQVGAAPQAGAKNRTKETKPHLLGQASLPFSETPLCNAVLVPPVCTWLSQEAAGDAALQLPLVAAPLWLPPPHIWDVSLPAPPLPPPLRLLVLHSTHTSLCCFVPQRMSSVTNDDI